MEGKVLTDGGLRWRRHNGGAPMISLRGIFVLRKELVTSKSDGIHGGLYLGQAAHPLRLIISRMPSSEHRRASIVACIDFN